MMPDAPVRFSTMNCCLSDSVSLAPSSRARGSTDPPGGYGETNLTGFSGQLCERTGREKAIAKHRRKNLEAHMPSSLQFEHFARLVGRRHGEAHLLDEAARLRPLLGVRFRELAAAEPQAVLQADAHVAAHHRRHGGDE